ncbi:MAG: DUF1571 domain-containing protein [Myxococcales bacterium]|nr:DUF1571 domain-containing protein [Myxococcales bacterium]MDH3485189.1 DUF1571 domain-containing protein [Myxococcales bacterium]
MKAENWFQLRIVGVTGPEIKMVSGPFVRNAIEPGFGRASSIAGRTRAWLFVPHYYGSGGKYFISKRTSLMIKAMTWDHYGRLYESYEYLYLELNPGLEDREFDHRNKDYNFMIIRHR